VEVVLGKPIAVWEKPIFVFSGQVSISSLALVRAGRHFVLLGKTPRSCFGKKPLSLLGKPVTLWEKPSFNRLLG